jgi:mono/diheme cytochrome c family protein
VRTHPRSTLLLALCILLGLAAREARAADPVADDFRQNCSSCHTIGGGKLTGPDLKDVGTRKDTAWLASFIVDPGAVLDRGDPYATQLLSAYNNVRMPNIGGMSKARAEALLGLIERESKLEKSQFAGLQMPSRPFSKADIARGRELFVGTARLQAGGASCISCHNAGGLGFFGGGRLGPDLTKVYERYGDRKKLGAWLTAPATPTMLPTFRDHPMDVDTEILPLVAWFEHTARTEQEATGKAGLALFFLLSIVGTGALLALGGRIWSYRFRAVRRPLTQRSSWRAGTRTPVPPPGAPATPRAN